ncbi:MAG: CDP-diacylglycerol--glycerol-3-phosphate 3-phosphatidyltransferase [Planctomycetia bacterium]|nr:CDP-diacylglycerol--glycerol-3-phosphate 3-phosphatidyltransferase [Planctomycetia bacterium]
MTSSEEKKTPGLWTVPNIMTSARIVLAVVLFAVLPMKMYTTALALFLVAAGTDWLDGWWARRYNLVSQLGRILDPFADKMIVCGTFIYLVTIPELTEPIRIMACPRVNWALAPWMVVVIVMRELLVTMLRSLIEGRGGDFSAKWIGKWKMALQCLAIGLCLLFLIRVERGDPLCRFLNFCMVVSLWGTVYLTVHSGIQYIIAASRAMKRD